MTSGAEMVEILGALFAWPLVVLVVGLLFGRDLLEFVAMMVAAWMRPKFYIVERRLGGRHVGGCFLSRREARHWLRGTVDRVRF